MDTQIKEIIGWILGLLATSVLTLALGIFNIVKAGKLMPKEMKEKDIDNKKKEADLAETYDKIATLATDKALKTQEKYDKAEIMHEERVTRLEDQFDKLQEQYEKLQEQYDVLESKIAHQDAIIKEQNKLIEEQTVKITLQETEMAKLVCELDRYKDYNAALINQMKEAQIIPLDIPENLDSPCLDNSGKPCKEDVIAETIIQKIRKTGKVSKNEK